MRTSAKILICALSLFGIAVGFQNCGEGFKESASISSMLANSPAIQFFTATPGIIIQGNSTTLEWDIRDAQSITLNPGNIDVTNMTTYPVNPAATTVYTITASNNAGSATGNFTVTVNPPPPVITAFAAASPTIISGQSVALNWTVTGATALKIDPGNITVTGMNTTMVMPTATTIYTLTASNVSGSVTQTVTVTVNPPAPVISSFASSAATIISGQSATLSWTTTGATSLRLDPGNLDVTGTTSQMVTPTANTTYTLTATNVTGSVMQTVAITVNPMAPAINSFTATPSTIISGQTTTLNFNAVRATTLVINPGNINVAGQTSISVSPTANTTYTLTATNVTGTVSSTVNVTVNPPLPVISSFAASAATITSGQSTTLSWASTGATSLMITPGNLNVTGLTSTTLSPTTTTMYTLTATNTSGSVTRTLTVTVNAAPPLAPTVATFTSSATTITAGQTATLSWSTTNATTLTLNPGNINVTGTTSRMVTPTATTTYTLVATNVTGTANGAITITVNPPAPTIATFSTSATTIISGQSATLSWSTTNATSLRLDPGNIDVSGTTTRVVSPTASTTYTLTATNMTGSVNRTVAITVNPPLPTITSLTATPATITSGQSSTLAWSTSGATSLRLDPGNIDVSAMTSRAVTPTTTTVYTLTATNASGSVTSTVTVNVGANLPTITSFTTTTPTITAGQSASLTWAATGATTLTITPGNINVTGLTTTVVSPATTTTYTLTATNTAGSVTRTQTITVNAAVPAPTISSFLASPASITAGMTSSLSWSVAGATSLVLTPGNTNVMNMTSTTVSPTATTTYTLTASNSTGTVTRTVTVTVTVDPVWVINPAPVFTFGSGASFDLKVSFVASGFVLATGGVFSVDPSGAPLPSGMSLDAATGILTVGTAAVGDTNGVVFAYTTPQ